MKRLLGDGYAEFERALTEDEPVRGVRLNRIKNRSLTPPVDLPLTPLSYVEGGYRLHTAEPVGTHPAHHSGTVYMQDPGAMATLCALDIAPDFKIIDLCAAPGGKSTQAAAMLGEDGFILSNEFVGKRARLMIGNFERLGVKNAMITSLDTAEFKKNFRSYFDLCIADVPCSGEGMFRKSEDALAMWSEENVAISAKRQAEILDNAAPLVRAGGYLLYSTCTYSLSENEMQIDAFLTRHAEFSLIPVKESLIAVTDEGVNFDGATHDLRYTRRFYPHKSPGEGQFIALMKKAENPDDLPTLLYKNQLKPLSKQETDIVTRFMKDTLDECPRDIPAKLSDRLVLSNGAIPPLAYGVLVYGILIGEIKGNSLIPSHQFYSAMGEHFKRRIELSKDEDRLSRYLHGEQIAVSEDIPQGFVALTYEGAVIGGGKCVGGLLNNHYPKGLRNKK